MASSNNARMIFATFFSPQISGADQGGALQRGLVFPGEASHPCHVQQAQRYHRRVRAAGADAGAPALRKAHEPLSHHLVLPASLGYR